MQVPKIISKSAILKKEKFQSLLVKNYEFSRMNHEFTLNDANDDSSWWQYYVRWIFIDESWVIWHGWKRSHK